VPLKPSGSTTGLGKGVLPSQRIWRYAAAPTCTFLRWHRVEGYKTGWGGDGIGREWDGDGNWRHTSYHRGPSAQILINFSLNSRVCLSMPLRSNFVASTVTSDFGYMVVACYSFLCPCSFFFANTLLERRGTASSQTVGYLENVESGGENRR